MSNEPQQQQGAFKKDMRKMDIWALALGAIIGWGCFVMPGTNFLPKAGPSAITGLLLGGCVMSIIAFSYGYCIKKYPLSGGEFVYVDASFGKKHAFACGWMIVLGYWSLIPLNATAIGMITRYLMPGIFQFDHKFVMKLKNEFDTHGQEPVRTEYRLLSNEIQKLSYHIGRSTGKKKNNCLRNTTKSENSC